MSNLKERKEQLKKDWEKCFEMEISDLLSEEGLSKFWDCRTSVEEAEVMLTVGSIVNAFDISVDGAVGAIIIAGSSNKKTEKKEQKSKDDNSYRVELLDEYIMFDETFETIDEAKEFIKNEALTTEYTVDDFRIIKVYE